MYSKMPTEFFFSGSGWPTNIDCIEPRHVISNYVLHLSIGTEMVFTLNLDKMNKIDILNGIQIRISLKTLLNPICILYIIVCLYMLFYVQSIQIKYV